MKQSFLIRMPSDLKEWLEQDAEKKGFKLTGLIMAIFNEYKDQQTNRKGGGGANSSRARLSDSEKIKILRSKIEKNESTITKLSKENTKLYKSVYASDFSDSEWDKWRANNKTITRLKRENANWRAQAQDLEIKKLP